MGTSNPPDLGVSVGEEVQVDEKVSHWKKWFNGSHFFYSVKVLPKKK